ncbi:hypothetical protein Tco_0785824 [Tanacetum coccineum]
MIDKNFVEIQGAFLVKIRDNTFNGTIGENAFGHINNFLEVVGPIKINGVSQDRFRLSVFPISLAGAASEWFKKDCIGSVTTWEDLVEKFVQKFYQLSNKNEEMEAEESDDTDDIAKIFMIEGNLFDYETPLWRTIIFTKNSVYDPSTCRVRRFEMIKYSFDADDEYVVIKEHECSERSETNIVTCQAYRELFRIMDEGWLMMKACDE